MTHLAGFIPAHWSLIGWLHGMMSDQAHESLLIRSGSLTMVTPVGRLWNRCNSFLEIYHIFYFTLLSSEYNFLYLASWLVVFPSPAVMSLTKLSLAGNNLIISGHGEFGKSTSRLGTGKSTTFFLQCFSRENPKTENPYEINPEEVLQKYELILFWLAQSENPALEVMFSICWN
jgi:hypothetical protein